MANRRLNEKKDKLEKPIVLSWSFGEPVIACSVPREAMVKYSTVLQAMRFQPGKKKHDHCWYIKNSERFRHSEKFVKAVAQRLMDAGAEVEIKYEGAAMKVMEGIVSNKENTMKFSRKQLAKIIREEYSRIYSPKKKTIKISESKLRQIIREELSDMQGVDPFGMPGEESQSPCAAKANVQQDKWGSLANPPQGGLRRTEPAVPMSLGDAYPGMEYEEGLGSDEEEEDMLLAMDLY